MRLRVTWSGRSRDLAVTLPDGSTSLAAVLAAAGVDPLPPQVRLDGRLVPVGEGVGVLPLFDGSTVEVDGRPAPDRAGAASLIQVAGGHSGRRTALPIGRVDLGPADPAGRVDAPVVRIEVEDGGAVTIATAGYGKLRLDGIPLRGPAFEPIRGDMLLATADAIFRVSPSAPGAVARAGRSGSPGHGGRVRYQRAAAVAPAPPPAVPGAPARPAAPAAAPQLSWAMVLAPIPLAVVMALLLGPHFVIFAAFTPLLALARWLEGRWRRRRAERRVEQDRARDLREYAGELAVHAARCAARMRRATPDLAELIEIARCGRPGLWSGRPMSDDGLPLLMGFGDRPGDWELPSPSDADAYAVARDARRMPDVPICLDAGRHLGVGIAGPGAAELAVTAVAQAAACHGPADLELAVVCDPDRAGRWDWLKWLPHIEADAGHPVIVTAAAEVTDLFGSSGSIGPGPDERHRAVRLVVVDSPALVDAVLAQLSRSTHRQHIRLCVIADERAALPSLCTHVATLARRRVTVEDLLTGQVVRGALPVIADPVTVGDLARALARYQDPQAEVTGSGLPTTLDLGRVLGGFSAPELARRWRDSAAGPHLLATLGADESGPLTVDLVSDGPHALVAGTTGAGKSELLRTLVASLACRYGPDRVNLILVDFKGGGAFDACADLPHTVGVLTDLDDALAARALRCLRAEVRHRERVLRAAGVSDLAELTGPDAPPRLVLIIDEFATLAAELPDFMNSLIDVAQRGRSLGLHLVLATQRPAGVVDGKIRANTNLRLALRVQSEADSHDVLAVAHAARIDRRTPGRGYVRLGAGELRVFQTALVSAATPAQQRRPVRVEAFTAAGTTPRDEVAAVSPGTPTDLARIVAASRTAADQAPPVRVPWPAPLPDRLSAEALWAADQAGAASVCLGRVDRPDAQRIDTFCWNHRVGPLLAYGADPVATTGVIVTAAVDLARRLTADRFHLYLLDFVPGTGLQRLAGLPHVAARVGPAEHELLIRTIDAVEQELDRRRQSVRAGAEPPLIMVGIAGYHLVTAAAEELGRLDLPGRLERLIAEGAPLGVTTVLTTHHERGVPGRLASQIGAKITFRLADPASYLTLGLRPRSVPRLDGHRGVDLGSGEEIVVATPEDIVSAGPGEGGPHLVRTLPDEITADDVSECSRRDGPAWRLAVGIRHRDLTPAMITLHPSSHLVITGGPASGRTTALRGLVDASRAGGPVELRVLTGRPDEWSRVSGDDVRLGPEALAQPVRSPCLIVIDGLAAAAAADARLLVLAEDPQVRMLVADRVDAFRAPLVWLRRVLASRNGLLLQPQPDHGDLLRVRLPMRAAVAYGPGRGFLVQGGLSELIQVALPAADSRRSAPAA